MITASDLPPNSAAPQWLARLARPTRSLRFGINTIFKTKIIISNHLDVILNSNTCHNFYNFWFPIFWNGCHLLLSYRDAPGDSGITERS